MELKSLPAELQSAVAFHGHLCPGLMIGWRTVLAARRALGVTGSADEELVAVVENDSCSVDAWQHLLHTTFGKGNLVWRDYGKQSFTLWDRKRDRAVRVAFIGEHFRIKDAQGNTDREAFMRALLEEPEEHLCKVLPVDPPHLPPARIEPSVRCARCGEPTQQSKLLPSTLGPICGGCAREIQS